MALTACTNKTNQQHKNGVKLTKKEEIEMSTIIINNNW